MAAATTTTAEFSAAIDRMRERIGTARISRTMRERPGAARLAGRCAISSRRGVPKTSSLHLANSFDQFHGRGIALRLGVDSRHRGFERLAVEIGHDRYARGFCLPARALLEIFPLLAHELAGSGRRLAKNLSIFARQTFPCVLSHYQHFRTPGVFGDGVLTSLLQMP